MSEIVVRVIKRKVIYIPVGSRVYRRVETLEEITNLPIRAYIDLTNEPDEERDLTCPNAQGGCRCSYHHNTHLSHF